MDETGIGYSEFSLDSETNPLVSIIIPTHKRAPKLAATIAAVNAQKYENIELILICTPDDETKQVVNSVTDIDLETRTVMQKTAGASEARNIGIDMANGEILAFTDDDCIPPKDWVSGIVAVFERYNVITTGGMNLPHRRVKGRMAAQVDNARLRRNQLPSELDRDENGVTTGGIELRTFGTSNVAYTADAVEQSSVRFDTELKRGEDADFQRKILEITGGQAAYLPIPVWHNRDYTLMEFLSQRYQNGKSDAQTSHGRTVSGSILGLLLSPGFLVWNLFRERPKTVGFGTWLGDVTARIGVLIGSIESQ